MRASVPQGRVTEKRRRTAAIFTLKAAGRDRRLLAESSHLCLPLARVLKVVGSTRRSDLAVLFRDTIEYLLEDLHGWRAPRPRKRAVRTSRGASHTVRHQRQTAERAHRFSTRGDRPRLHAAIGPRVDIGRERYGDLVDPVETGTPTVSERPNQPLTIAAPYMAYERSPKWKESLSCCVPHSLTPICRASSAARA